MFNWIAYLSSMTKFAIRAVMTALVLLILPGVLSIILPGLKGHVVFDLFGIKAAQAAAVYVQKNGSNSHHSNFPVSSIQIDVSANQPAVGNTVIVTMAMDYSSPSGAASCTDNMSNTYTLDMENKQGNTIVVVCSAQIATAKVPSTITVTHTNAYDRAVTVHEFSGLLTAPAKDKTSSGGGTSTAPSSGTTATTAQADEMILGVVAVAGPDTDSFTADGNFPGGPDRLGINTGNNRTINMQYRVVSSTGTYSYVPTLGTSHEWSAAVVTYKAAASTINISGSCKQSDQTTDCTDAGAGDTIKVAVNGTLQGQTQATVSGTWTISAVTEPTLGDVITVFIDGAASGTKKAVAVTKYDGAGDITGVALIEEHLTIGSDENQTISNTDLSQYDNSVSTDADVFYEVDASNDLTVDTLAGLSNDELYIQTGNTYRPDSASSGNVTTHNLENNGTIIADGNTFNLTGTWNNNSVFTAGTSTISFVPNTSSYYFYPGASSYYNVTINSNGYFFYLGNNVTVTNTLLFNDLSGFGVLSFSTHTVTTKDFTWQDGYLTGSAHTIEISGNFTNTGGGYFSGAGPTTIRFNGAGDSTFSPRTLTHGNVTINKDNQTDAVSVSGNPLKMAGSTTLDITSGILDIAGNNLDIGASSAFSNTGTLRLQGGETISNLTNDVDSGTVLYNGAAGPYTGLAVGDAYYNLALDGVGSWNLDTALDVDGNFDITSGTLNASGFNINVAGNWNSAGTFTHGGGTQTVTLDGGNQSISGSTTFNNLSKTEASNDATDAILTFDNTATQTVDGLLTLDGLDADDRINLISDSPTNQWGLTANGTFAIDFVEPTDSDANAGLTIVHTNSISGGNNLNWGFVYEITGKVFEDAKFSGTAADYVNETDDKALANVDVELYNNSDVYQSSTTTDVNGDFSFTGLADATYKVRVRAATIADADTTPKGGLNGTVPGTWPYPIPELAWVNGSAMYGGQSATADDTDTADNAGPGDNWVSVAVSDANVSNVNFGYAYNLIVNVEEDGNADSSLSDQGSLRQFIKNANAIGTADSTTANSSEFRMQVATNQVNGADNWWRITPVAALPQFVDGGTRLDGSRQRVNSASDDNSRGPEIEIYGNSAGSSNGFVINNVANVTIQELAINSFTLHGVSITGASASAATLYSNYIGIDAVGSADMRNDDSGVIVDGPSAVIGGVNAGEGNLIAYNWERGIGLTSTGANTQIIGNEIRNQGYSGIASFASNVDIVKNLIRNNTTRVTWDEVGISTGNRVYHNTIHGSPAGDGISVEGANAVIRNNIITGHAGYGIRISGGSIAAESHNLITDASTSPANGLGQISSGSLDGTSFSADPLYTNSGAGDFTLQVTSPAINTGCDLGMAGDDTACDNASDSAQPDVNGATGGNYNGSAPDMGAYESSVAGIFISGTCKQLDEATDCTDTGTVRVAINGTLQAQTQAIVAGTWTISGVTQPSTGDIITVFIDGAADANEAVAVTKYDGSGNITDIQLMEEHLTLGSDDNQTLTNADLSQYDYSASGNNEDIFIEVDGVNDLTVDNLANMSNEELYIKAGNTYQPDPSSLGNVTSKHVTILGTLIVNGNTITASGDWENNGTFTADSSSVIFNGTNQTINGSNTFFNLSKNVVATDTLTFDATGTQSIATGGNVSLNGVAGNLLQLRSSSTPIWWGFNVDAGATTDINYVDVQDSDASTGATVSAFFSLGSAANNLNWSFENLQLVKQVWSSGGSPFCLASRPAKADCNSSATTTVVPVGSTIYFLIYVSNVSGATASDIRFTDLLDDTGFTYLPNTLESTATGSEPADTASSTDIFNATTTARSDAFDGDTGSDEFTGIDTSVSPDNLTAGGDGSVGSNDTINIPPNKTFAIRFQATKN